ncbi:hypothetical protein [Corynebacterium sp. 11A]|uniref:hypothetical protein n=1 Tax=Corynebacterium sp. 11A TaxID=2080510 RepID=UPI00124DEA14|nr:hypothetical protein [Corynebacterium sp. 11A]
MHNHTPAPPPSSPGGMGGQPSPGGQPAPGGQPVPDAPPPERPSGLGEPERQLQPPQPERPGDRSPRTPRRGPSRPWDAKPDPQPSHGPAGPGSDQRQQPPRGGRRTEPESKERPESIDLAVKVWWVLIIAEVLRHVVLVLTTAMNPREVASQVIATMDSEQVSQLENLGDTALNLAVIGYYVVIMLFAFAILAIVAWMVNVIARAREKAPSAKRLLTFFGIYFTIRALFVFFSPPPMSDPNSVQFLIDGSLQIVVGVAAVLGLVFFSRPESKTWIEPAETQR